MHLFLAIFKEIQEMGEKYYFILLDISGQDRLRVRIETTKGGVNYFVVQYETIINDEWVAIVRYDLAHGFFHRDATPIRSS